MRRRKELRNCYTVCYQSKPIHFYMPVINLVVVVLVVVVVVMVMVVVVVVVLAVIW